MGINRKHAIPRGSQLSVNCIGGLPRISGNASHGHSSMVEKFGDRLGEFWHKDSLWFWTAELEVGRSIETIKPQARIRNHHPGRTVLLVAEARARAGFYEHTSHGLHDFTNARR